MENLSQNVLSPSHKYIEYAEKINIKKGHENLGFLSFKRGFMPLNNPSKSLPAPFNIWDKIAQNLPHHYENQNLRIALHKMPILDASKKELEDKHLCRASMLMSILAHAYVRNERNEDLNIPESITKPWEIITKRLNRPKPFLSYIDLIIYNWKVKDTTKPLELENLQLLTPTVNNNEEQIFYLTQTEIAFKTKDTLQAIVAIQNAIVNDNKKQVIKGLLKLQEIIKDVTESSFLKINPNPHSKTYVDPVVWAKTVAPFAVPLKEGVQGPSGTSSPFFHLIDTFIERAKYDTILGKEALFIREWYPEHWRNLLNEIDKVSITAYIEKINDNELHGAFHSLIESYSGDQGFLGVHRRKVYGYLQMAFKVGRSVTIGGFSGLFKERTWEEVDDELETTRLERYADKKLRCPYSNIIKRESIGENTAKSITLDTTDKGLSYRIGDRCAIVPKNCPDKINNLLSLMSLNADEPIELNDVWQTYFKEYYNKVITVAPISELLLCAKLNNVGHILEKCPHLGAILNIQDKNYKLPLQELVIGFKDINLNIKQTLLPHLITILIPEEERMYSISSGFGEQKIELTVGTAHTKINGKVYKGVTSEYLHSDKTNKDTKIPIKIIRPLRFTLPKKLKNEPIYLFAGGTGIAPFKGFWEALKKQNRLQNLVIFYSVKFKNNIIFKKELLNLLINEAVNVNIIVTRENLTLNKSASISKNKLVFDSVNKAEIANALLKTEHTKSIYNAIKSNEKGGSNGYFYTCGKAGFSLTILNQIKHIISLFTISDDNDPKELFYSLFSENRYMQDIFTSPNLPNKRSKTYNMSEIVYKNNNENGYWTVIMDKVYDLTEFKEIHPGGDKIVIDNAGRDATHEFKRANHDKSNEIMSMLSMYIIGDLKKVNFRNIQMKKEYDQWLSALNLCTEMLNTYIADFSFKKKQLTTKEKTYLNSPYKFALMVENQNRFKVEYTKNIKEILKTLYENNPNLKETISLFDKITDLKQNNNQNWITIVQSELKNKNILSSLRKILWKGLKVFESYKPQFDPIFRMSIDNLLYQFKEELIDTEYSKTSKKELILVKSSI